MRCSCKFGWWYHFPKFVFTNVMFNKYRRHPKLLSIPGVLLSVWTAKVTGLIFIAVKASSRSVLRKSWVIFLMWSASSGFARISTLVDRFYDYLNSNHFEVRTGNNPLTYVTTTTKLVATSHRYHHQRTILRLHTGQENSKLNRDANRSSKYLEQQELFSWRSQR